MGFRFFRRVRIIPGVRLNLSKSGMSASLGGRGAWFTVGPKRTRTTVGLPGTGLYYTQANSWKGRNNGSNEAAGKVNRPPWGRIILALGIGLFLLETCGDHPHPLQQSLIALPAPPSALIAPSAAPVVADYCVAHPGAPSCRTDTTPAPASAVLTLDSDPHPAPDFQPAPSAAAVVAGYCAAHPGAPSCRGDIMVRPAWCANLSTMVFDTPEEVARARAACGLNSPQGIHSPAPHREFRAQVPAFSPQTHHGRN